MLLLAPLLVAAGPSAPGELVGVWESVQRTRGGIGNTLELRPDGTVTQTVLVMVDFGYRIADGKLEVSFADDEAGETHPALPVSFADGDLLLTQADGTVQRRERVAGGEPGDPPIVGVWSYPHPAGAVAYERYLPDGTAQLRIPLQPVDGRYRVEGDALAIEVEGSPGSQPRVEVAGDELRLTPEGGVTRTYRRLPGGPWWRPRPGSGG